MSQNLTSASFSKRKTDTYLQKKYEEEIKVLNEKIHAATTNGHYAIYISILDSYPKNELTSAGYKVEVSSDGRFRISWAE